VEIKSVKISVEELSEKLGMAVLCKGTGFIDFTSDEINRPGLQFTGFYEHFSARRVQLIGNAEWYYLNSLTEDVLSERMERFMRSGAPCIVCSRGNQPPRALLLAAERYAVPVFVSELLTGAIEHNITEYLERKLAPRILIHGVLMDVFGVGMLIRGESGLGKSETAIEMIRAGHRLVADDVIEITRVSDTLVGYAPEATRHLVEVRGIGIVDVRYLFGVGAVIPEKSIDMAVDIELWNENTQYERMGMGDRRIELLGVSIPGTVVPVSPGRNLAVVVEVAARNFRLIRMGYDATLEFRKNVEEFMK
jgi:HPr kinase/phosphorylase